MLILHLADVELKWSIIHSTPPFLECIVAYYATSLYKTGYGSLLTENLMEKWNSIKILIEFAKSSENQSIIIIRVEELARFLSENVFFFQIKKAATLF
jgi:hypothetical protein